MTSQREIERLTRQRLPIPRVVRGLDWWFCPFCPWDRDDEVAVREHIASHHPVAEPTALQRETAAAREAAEREAAATAEATPPARTRARTTATNRTRTRPVTARAAATEETGDATNDDHQDGRALSESDRRRGGDGDGGGRDESQPDRVDGE